MESTNFGQFYHLTEFGRLNRLTSLAPPSAFGSGSFGFSYDALSRRTQMTRPNNVTTSYTYDNLSRLTSVLHQLSGSTIDGASYTLDAAGNRTAKTDQLAAVTSSYTYDPIYQLTQVTQANNTTESYSYDAVGNRTGSLGVPSYTTNASNELTATSNGSFTYDSNGNTLTKTVGSNTTSYTWDYENRLTSVTLPGTAGTVTFKYDPLGRRIYKSSSAATIAFAYDGNNLLETVSSGGSVVSRFAQADDIDDPLAEDRSGTISYYEADGLGSISSLTSAAGALAETYTYDSFGNLINSTGSVPNPFGYTAREFDSETGLYFYRARYYDPSAGKFLSEDSTRFKSEANFYRYALGNPTNLKDPTGNTAASIALPASEAIGGLICFGSGACETAIVVTGVTFGVAATTYAVYSWYESRSRGRSDPIPFPGAINPGQCDKEPEKCKPCPPDSPYWNQPGNAHGSTTGVHYHWYHWNQAPYPDCTCYPARMDGPTPPAGGTPWSPGGAPWP